MAIEIPNVIGSSNDPAAISDIEAQPESGHWQALSRNLSFGVQSGCAVTAQGSPDNTVAVAAGQVLAPETTNERSITGGNVTITDMASNPRIDVIVTNTTSKIARAGTPAAVPCFPAFSANDVPLAWIFVPAGSGPPTITADNIHDLRALKQGGTDYPHSRLEFKDQSTPPATAGNRVQLYGKLYGATSRLFTIGNDAVELGPVGDIAGDLLYQKSQRGGFVAPHTALAEDGFDGLLGGTLAAHFTGAVPTIVSDTYGRYIQMEAAAAAAGSEFGYRTANTIARLGSGTDFMLPRWMAKIVIPTITSVRLFIGFTNNTLVTQVSSDTPGGTYVGCGFSTDRGDANFQAVNFDGAGTERVTNTGVAVAANTPYYVVFIARGTGLSMQLAIYDKAFALLAITSFSALDTPGTTTDMAWMMGGENRAAALRNLRAYYGNIVIQGA